MLMFGDAQGVVQPEDDEADDSEHDGDADPEPDVEPSERTASPPRKLDYQILFPEDPVRPGRARG
jgi:hypothetical protein